jgi:hypothetical protein
MLQNMGPSDDHHPDDFIKTEYHPKSRLPTTTLPFDHYTSQQKTLITPFRSDEHSKRLPIDPFSTLGDYLFARAAIENNLTNDAIDAFLHIHHLSKDPPVTFKNHRDVRKTLDEASGLLTEVMFCV